MSQSPVGLSDAVLIVFPLKICKKKHAWGLMADYRGDKDIKVMLVWIEVNGLAKK